MKKAIVTGGTGAIGRALIRALTEDGYEVLAVLHRQSGRAGDFFDMPHCRVLFLNLDEYGSAVREMERQHIPSGGYELFFHLAWQSSFGSARDDADVQTSNITASLAAVRFAKAVGCSTFVGTGSQAEYGRTDKALSPETPAFPESGYGIAKLCAGQMTRLLCAQEGLRHIWCRVLSVYGPWDRDETLIASAVHAMLAGEETSFTACEQMWDYLYADDAAEALLCAAQKGEDGKIYVVGGAEAHPLREYIETIARLTGYTEQIGFGRRAYNPGQVMFLKADPESLRSIGFIPRVSFEEGIRRTIAWQRERGRTDAETEGKC